MSCIVGVTQNAHYDIFYPSPRGAKLHHYGRYDAINTKQYPSPRGAKLYQQNPTKEAVLIMEE